MTRTFIRLPFCATLVWSAPAGWSDQERSAEPATFYGGDRRGYTDYPILATTER